MHEQHTSTHDQKGADRLRTELEHLKGPKRQAIIAAVAEARAHGDLKENAEYHAAREEHFNEGRIAELEAALSNSEVIDTERLAVGSRIVFGAIVELVDLDSMRKSPTRSWATWKRTSKRTLSPCPRRSPAR